MVVELLATLKGFFSVVSHLEPASAEQGKEAADGTRKPGTRETERLASIEGAPAE